MSRRDLGTTIFAVISVVLVACSAAAAAVSITREGLGANGAAWVQASGSIAAIAGAVWLSRAESIRRRRERRLFGEEIAWSVRFALTNAQLECRTIAAELVDEQINQKPNPSRHWLLRTANCANVLRIYAERTDHIHPALNHISSNGMLLLRQMDEDIGFALVCLERGERPSIAAATDVAWYEAHFEELIQMLDARMRGVLQALAESDDASPVHRFKMWAIPDEERAPKTSKQP